MVSLPLNLSSSIAAILEEILTSRLHGVAIMQRARCILLAHGNRKFVDISRIVQLSSKSVSRWVHRFADSQEALQHNEQKKSQSGPETSGSRLPARCTT
jgi:hypothetical protein